MGNLHSSWINRNNRQDTNSSTTRNSVDDPSTQSAGNSASSGEHRGLQYNLRNTASRLRRRFRAAREPSRRNVSNNTNSVPRRPEDEASNLARMTLNNTSATSVSSNGSTSRRRAREVDQEEAMLEENIRNAARRIRVDAAEALARQAFTPEPDDAAMYFYFPMSIDPSETTNNNTSDNPARVVAPSPLRRSTRLNSTPSPTPSEHSDASSSEDLSSTQQQHVLVRLRHIRPPNTTEDGPNQMSTFQWTIYFVLPRREGATQTPPPAFNPNDAIQRAFAVLRAMMAGDNMGYEEWMRLQEMLGNVNRGVSKEQVEAQCASQAFTSHLNIGIRCPICLTDYADEEKVRTLPCLHSYHADCIDTWLHSCNNCPLCRQQPVQVEETPSNL